MGQGIASSWSQRHAARPSHNCVRTGTGVRRARMGALRARKVEAVKGSQLDRCGYPLSGLPREPPGVRAPLQLHHKRLGQHSPVHSSAVAGDAWRPDRHLPTPAPPPRSLIGGASPVVCPTGPRTNGAAAPHPGTFPGRSQGKEALSAPRDPSTYHAPASTAAPPVPTGSQGARAPPTPCNPPVGGAGWGGGGGRVVDGFTCPFIGSWCSLVWERRTTCWVTMQVPDPNILVVRRPPPFREGRGLDHHVSACSEGAWACWGGGGVPGLLAVRPHFCWGGPVAEIWADGVRRGGGVLA